MYMVMQGLEFGPGELNDYAAQHIKFIDFIRGNFFLYHDLFPQLMTNFGLGQSFATIYYYGMYNPIVLISFVFKNITTKDYIAIINLIIILNNVISMRYLLKKRNVSEKSSRIVSVLFAFSGCYIYHLTNHILFIYYVPIMIYSLLYIHRIVEKNKYYYLPIFIGLIFYTNFYFAPVISVVQFVYFNIVLMENKSKKIVKKNTHYLFYYLLGVLIGSVMIITQFCLASIGARGSIDLTDEIGFFKYIYILLAEPFSSGIGYIALVSIVGSILIYKKKRLPLYLNLIIFLLICFAPFNLILNVFQYYNSKIIIYILPFLFISLAYVMDMVPRKILMILILALSTYTAMYLYSIEEYEYILFNIVNGLLLIYYLYLTSSKNNIIKSLTLLLIAIVGFASFIDITKVEDMDTYQVGLPTYSNEYIELSNLSEGDYGYRQLPNISYVYESNSLPYNSAQIPSLYTSLENNNYINFINGIYRWESVDTPRIQSLEMFNNMYLRNYLGIKYYYDLDGNLVVNDDVNSIVYGVDKNDVYDFSELMSLSKSERDIAINQALFTESASNYNVYENKFDVKKILEHNEEFIFFKPEIANESVSGNYKLPENIKDKEGTIIITLDASYVENPKIDQMEYLKVENHRASALSKGRYYDDQNLITFVLDKPAGMDELNYSVAPNIDGISDPVVYSNLNIYFQETSDFESNKLDITKPTEFELIPNSGYKATINMEEEGYLATTIPYDEGFTVKIDNEEVEYELINGCFLGAKLPKGEHEIEITYEIIGFKLGMLLTIIGILLTIFIILYHKLYKEK